MSRIQMTRAAVETLIRESDNAAMRAVCAIYRQQTLDEKMAKDTKHDNDRGFSQAHAKIGTELATWMTEGNKDGVMRRRTAGKFPSQWTHAGTNPRTGKNIWKKNTSAYAGRPRLVVCRELALHYAGQITQIANGTL